MGADLPTGEEAPPPEPELTHANHLDHVHDNDIMVMTSLLMIKLLELKSVRCINQLIRGGEEK